MINLYIVRHGETIENSKNICQGQSEGHLSEKGIRENQKLALELSSVKFDVAYCSTLTRAKLTCESIVTYHPHLNIYFDNRLMEWHMGKLQGNKFPKEKIDLFNNEYDIESFESVRKRCTDFLKDISQHKSKSNLLIISHGLTIKMLCSIIHSQSFNEFSLIPNSSYIKISFENACWNKNKL